MTIALYFLAFFILIKIFQVYSGVTVLRNVRLKKEIIEPVELEQVPEYIRELYQKQAGGLLAMGFSFFHCYLSDGGVAFDEPKHLCFFYVNPVKRCYAVVNLSGLPDKYIPVKFAFYSIFSDKSKVFTYNGYLHDVIGSTPGVKYYDWYVDSIAKQYEMHLQMVEKNMGDKQLVLFTPEEFMQLLDEHNDEYIKNLQTQKYVTKTAEPSLFQMRIIPAIMVMLKAMKGLSKTNKMAQAVRKRINSFSISLDEVPVEVEVTTYKRLQKYREHKKSGGIANLVVFLVSMILFMVSFKMRFSFMIVFQLVLILIIHELGHYLAMKMCKYTDLKIMFIPFMGAATMGKGEQNASALQKAIVYLMGPGPGIIIGTLLYIFFHESSKFVSDFSILMLTLNYINLLPILPLDGGRVFELALFSKHKIFKDIFMFISLLAMLGLALAFPSPYMLVLPTLMAISLYNQFTRGKSEAKLNKQIQSEGLVMDDDTLLPRIFLLLREKPFSDMSFIRKMVVVQSMLTTAVKNVVTVRDSILSVGLYILVFVSPLIMIFCSGVVTGFSALDIGSSSVDIYILSPDKQEIFVAGRKNFMSFNEIVDLDGKLITKLKCESPDDAGLFWVPDVSSKKVLYSKIEKGKSSLWARGREESVSYYLSDIQTGEKKLLGRQMLDSSPIASYESWSQSGKWLLGYEFDDYDQYVRKMFRINVDSLEKSEINISELEIVTYTSGYFMTDDTAVVEMTDYNTDQVEFSYAVLNFSDGTVEKHDPNDVVDIAFSPNSNSVYLLQRIFDGNMVKHQIVKTDVPTNEETIVVGSETLPQYSDEDDAENKIVQMYFQLSPQDQWLTYAVGMENNDKAVLYLVNMKTGVHYELCEYPAWGYMYIIYSDKEDKILAFCEDDYDSGSGINYEIYNLESEKPEKTGVFNQDSYCYDFNFLDDNRILFIQYMSESNDNELWFYDIGEKRCCEFKLE